MSILGVTLIWLSGFVVGMAVQGAIFLVGLVQRKFKIVWLCDSPAQKREKGAGV